jgi:heme exporter protein A
MPSLSPRPDSPAQTQLPAAGVLSAHGLGCRRGRRRLFGGLNLQLLPGHITWLRGTNGSGKTSLMRILAGLSAPAEGELRWNGQPLAAAQDAARRAILYIGHANALKDDLSLCEALAFLARLQGLDDAPARALAALDRLALGSRRDAMVRTLSQGQRRRGALARLALDDKARTWILDEPYDALDRDSMVLLSGLIEAHAARGGTVLLTSHQAVDLPGAIEFDLEPFRPTAPRPQSAKASP